MPLLTFTEALQQSGNNDKLVLLGNGFSIAFSYDMFSYSSLYNKGIVERNDEQLQEVFEALETRDFEVVMKSLNSSSRISQIYSCGNECIDLMHNAIENVKAALIDVIVESHPENSRIIEETKYNGTNRFLQNFKSFYTTNYDFLLYWCLFRGHSQYRPRFNDGFSRDTGILEWTGGTGQNLFYLHGALHLYHQHTSIEKIAYLNGVLRDQVRERITDGKFPMIVSEGSSHQKLERIESNKYLMHAYSNLQNASGSLFIHGHSMSDNDDHLWNAIKNNANIDKLFISIHGDPRLQHNAQTIAKAISVANNRYINFYTSESVRLWQDPTEVQP